MDSTSGDKLGTNQDNGTYEQFVKTTPIGTLRIVIGSEPLANGKYEVTATLQNAEFDDSRRSERSNEPNTAGLLVDYAGAEAIVPHTPEQIQHVASIVGERVLGFASVANN